MPSLDYLYLNAKATVIEEGFAEEIRWQSQQIPADVTESCFLRETAWVVLSAGMRESVIRAKFDAFSNAFLDWKSGRSISDARKTCAQRAKRVFGHEGKINAILSIADHVANNGFKSVLDGIASVGCDFLRKFPYLGPATSRHLAKNLGIDVAKPDRHLVRAAYAAGFDSPAAFCKEIGDAIGDRIAVVDIVIWRFATINPHYEQYFSQHECASRRASRRPRQSRAAA